MIRLARFAATLTATFPALTVASAVASAQGTTAAYKREIPATLEHENGKSIYSYEFEVAGTSGIEEVNVNAIDGTMVGVGHESPADEKNAGPAGRKAVKKP